MYGSRRFILFFLPPALISGRRVRIQNIISYLYYFLFLLQAHFTVFSEVLATSTLRINRESFYGGGGSPPNFSLTKSPVSKRAHRAHLLAYGAPCHPDVIVRQPFLCKQKYMYVKIFFALDTWTSFLVSIKQPWNGRGRKSLVLGEGYHHRGISLDRTGHDMTWWHVGSCHGSGCN